MTNTIQLLAAGAAALMISAASALGANFSFTGNFSGDDQILLYGFTVNPTSIVTLKTLSYAGGTNAVGAVIPGGGFDPVLSLFRSDGVGVIFNDDVNSNVGNFESLISQSLVAGSYTLALTQATSTPVGLTLAQGFNRSGAQNFNGQNSSFAVDILNVATASLLQPRPPGVPDAGSTLALFLLSLSGLIGLRRFAKTA